MDGLKGLDTRAPLQLDCGFRFCPLLVLESRSLNVKGAPVCSGTVYFI